MTIRAWRSLAAAVLFVALAAMEPGARIAHSPRRARPSDSPERAPGSGEFPREPAGSAARWREWKESHPPLSSTDSGGDPWPGTWREMGPTNVAGRVNAVAFLDPGKPRSLVAGTAGGGILSTGDFGATWTRLGGDDLPSLWIGAIAVDPKNPGVFYAGTGDGNISSSGVGGAGGILKTSDGGKTFRLLPLPDTGAFYRIVVSASNSDVVIAAANDALYRSGDAGETWEKAASSATPLDVVQDPKNPLRFLATSGKIRGGNGGLFESLDEGHTWNAIGQGLPEASTWGRSALTMTDLPVPSLYLWMDKTSDEGTAQLYRSLDDAATWEPLVQSGIDATHGNGGWGAHLKVLGSPAGQTLVHHDGFLMYTARDSGPISSSTPWAFTSGGLHADTHGIDVSRGDTSLWAAATDGGVGVSSDGALTFARVDQGFPTVQFYSCALVPGDRTTILGGTQDNSMNVYRGDPGGAFELSFPPRLGDVGGISVNPANPAEVVVATAHVFSVAVSTDTGRTWEETTQNGIAPNDYVTVSRTAVVRSTVDPERVYLGTHRLTISDDGGRHWIQHDVRPSPIGGIAAMAVSAGDTEIWTLWSDGKVYLSSDRGTTWLDRSPPWDKALGTAAATGPDGATFAAIAVTSGPRLFRTRDHGASWQDVSADLPPGIVHALSADPRVPGRLLAGGDHGALISDDDGDHWRPIGRGLPNTVVNDVCLDTATDRLVAATYGRGMWQILPPPRDRRVIGVTPPEPAAVAPR